MHCLPKLIFFVIFYKNQYCGVFYEKKLFFAQIIHFYYNFFSFSSFCGILYGIFCKSNEILSWIDNCKNNLNPHNPSAHKINILTNIQESVQMFATYNQEIMGSLFKNSIIVSKQPPLIITMFEQRALNPNQNNGDNKKRRSRFWFDTELR